MDMLGNQRMRQLITDYYQSSGEPNLVNRAVQQAWTRERKYSLDLIDGTEGDGTSFWTQLKCVVAFFVVVCPLIFVFGCVFLSVCQGLGLVSLMLFFLQKSIGHKPHNYIKSATNSNSPLKKFFILSGNPVLLTNVHFNLPPDHHNILPFDHHNILTPDHHNILTPDHHNILTPLLLNLLGSS